MGRGRKVARVIDSEEGWDLVLLKVSRCVEGLRVIDSEEGRGWTGGD